MGLFDMQKQMNKIDANGDVLVKLNDAINWEMFRPLLSELRHNATGVSKIGGASGYDVVLIFKMMILQSLYNLSDDKIEFMVLDRLSFMRFLGLNIGDKVPDAKCIWKYRERMKAKGLYDRLFREFDAYLRKNGYTAQKGQIVDATIIQVPRQRNTRDENEAIKAGWEAKDFTDWSENKQRQKDTDARWKQKNGKNYFGYENHVQVDVKHKFIRAFEVTDASVHDSQVFVSLLDESNTHKKVYADSAYSSQENIMRLKELGYKEAMHRKANRDCPLSDIEREKNHRKSHFRSRVEHVFGDEAQRMGNRLVRVIGIARTRCVICLRNLAYNLKRLTFLQSTRGIVS